MTEADWLDAITLQPDDDLVRFACADWYEEQGQQARAEFIRWQCRAAALPEGPERLQAQETARQIRWKHEDRWLGPLRRRARWWRFHRGFVEEGGFNLFRFLTDAATIFAATPLRRVSVNPCGGQVAQLLTIRQLRRLTHLDLYGNAIGDEGASQLAIADMWPALTMLHLARNNITGPGTRALAESACLPNLRVLDVRDNPIGEAGVRALLEAPRLPRLEVLCVSPGGLSDELIGQLRQRYRLVDDLGRYLPYAE